MSISKQEKMKLLLEQIQLSETSIQKYFASSYLEKVEVYKQEKKWHFYIYIEDVLPFDEYLYLYQSLQKSFSSIAEKVELTLHTDNKQCSENDIGVYWKHFLATTTFSPAHQEMIMQQTPKITDNKIMLTSRNETESNILKKDWSRLSVNFVIALAPSLMLLI